MYEYIILSAWMAAGLIVQDSKNIIWLRLLEQHEKICSVRLLEWMEPIDWGKFGDKVGGEEGGRGGKGPNNEPFGGLGREYITHSLYNAVKKDNPVFRNYSNSTL